METSFLSVATLDYIGQPQTQDTIPQYIYEADYPQVHPNDSVDTIRLKVVALFGLVTLFFGMSTPGWAWHNAFLADKVKIRDVVTCDDFVLLMDRLHKPDSELYLKAYEFLAKRNRGTLSEETQTSYCMRTLY